MTSKTTKRGIIYIRVSCQKQKKQGRSLTDQKESLKIEAQEREIKVEEIIADGAKSGTDFDREGIKKVHRLANEKDISYLLVDEIDRIGRHAIESLYFIHELREECGVTIISNEVGELDTSDYTDLIYVIMRALSSQSTNETSTRRSVASRVQGFKNRNWSSVFQKVPFGYKLNSNDWLSKIPRKTGIMVEMCENFLDAEPRRAYTETLEKTRHPPRNLDTSQLRELLGRPVYIGEPTTNFVDQTRNPESKSSTTVCDESLRIISDEMHHAVQEKKELMESIHCSGDNDTVDLETLANNFGPETLAAASDIIEIHCPECYTSMSKNGTYDQSLFMVHNHICSADGCDKQCKYPTTKDWDNIIKEHVKNGIAKQED